MKKIILLTGVILIVVVGFLMRPKEKEEIKKDTFVANKTFDVKGLNYSFDVKEIRVKLKDKVRINFTNTEGFHDFKIDELGVSTKVIKAGEMESVEFIANKVGVFDYFCSVGQHRANGMWGKIIVE
jgi:plastocyanin